jgi:hypothetical protein
MLQLFAKENYVENITAEIIKISVQHVSVYILTAIIISCWQKETFWPTSDLKSTLCYYCIHLLLLMTVPWFTVGEHVSSMTRQCFIVGVA